MLLSLIIFLPIFGAILLLFLPNKQANLFKGLSLAITFVQLLLCVLVFVQFESSNAALSGIARDQAFQFREQFDWINLNLGDLGHLSIQYFVGVDGLSVGLLLLTGIVMFIGAVSSWSIQQNLKGYFSLYLLLSGSVAGCFVALDFFLFYLFFEFMLLPMYFLIGIWGGERREYASIKFFIYTLVGSIFILVVMIGLYLSVADPLKTAEMANLIQQAEQASPELIEKVQNSLQAQEISRDNVVRTFSLTAMMESVNYLPGSLLHENNQSTWGGLSWRAWAFLALLIGFAIKLPVAPLHTWLPDAHVEAPTPISVVLAGILLKIGGYGLLRIAYSIFPAEALSFASIIAFFGVFSIIYGALNALAMSDLKKMIAYSSVSHMGFVLLGIASLTAEGVNGAVYQMFSHGILSALLFLLVGVLYDRTHDRQIAHYRGLVQRTPYYTTFVLIAFFASLGLPGFSGFIGELLTLIGGFQSSLLPFWMAALAAFGIVLGAAYFLWTLQRMFFGKFWLRDAQKWQEQLHDLRPREWFMLSILSALTLLFGLFPSLLLNSLSNSVEAFLILIINN